MTEGPLDAMTTGSGVSRDAAKTALAAGGLLAALGAASCCVLPIALAAFGLSAASLSGVGFLAAPYQQELFVGAMALLAATGLVMWRQQVVRACATGSACARPALD